MGKLLTEEVLAQFKYAISMVRPTIAKFSQEQWTSGLSWFQVPAKVAYHTVECLDCYFGTPGEPFPWGSRFGKSFWELEKVILILGNNKTR